MTNPTNNDIRIGISVVADSAGTTKARQELANVRREIEDLKKSFRTGAIGTGEFSKQLADAEKKARTLDKVLDALGEKRRINLDTGALEDPSKASGAAALQTLGRDIRHLPSVRVPGIGVGTDTFGRAAEVAGRLGLNLEQVAVAGTATVIAVGLMAVAFKSFADEAKRQAAELTAVVEARRDVGQDIAGGLTSEGAAERLEEINRLRAEEQKLLDETSTALKQAQKDTSVANLLGGDFESTQGSRFFSGLIPQVAALQDQVDKSTSSVAGLTAEETALNKALEDGTLAANDAAAAHQKLTQELLTDAGQAGDLASLKARAAELTKEQIDSELEALARRKVGVEAELAVLEASGDTSEEVSKKIAQLKDQLGFLGDQAGVLNAAKPKAKSSEAEKAAEKAAKEAEKTQEKAVKDQQKRLEDAAKAQQNYSDKLRDATQSYRDAISDINQGLKDDFFDNNQKLLDDLAEGTIEFNQGELKEERQYHRDLAQIRRDANREEQDAVRARDFAALADARERGADALSDRRRAEEAENADQLEAFQQQRESLGRERDIANRDAIVDAGRARRDAGIDRDRAYRDARQDLNDFHRDRANQEQTFMRSSLQSWDSFYKQVGSMQRQALGGSSSRPTTSSGRGSSTPSFDDQLAFIMNPR